MKKTLFFLFFSLVAVAANYGWQNGLFNLPYTTASTVLVSDSNKFAQSATTTTTEVQLLHGRTNLGQITLSSNTTPVNSEVNMSYLVAANQMSNNGDSLTMVAFFPHSDMNINTSFGGQNFFIFNAGDNADAYFSATLTRLTSSTLAYFAQGYNEPDGLEQLTGILTGVDFTTTNSLAFTSPGDAMTQDLLNVYYLPGVN